MGTFRTRDNTGIYYKDWDGGGKPVLFSHGWPADADMWDRQMLFLAERGFRTIAFDRRGFGRSDQPWQGYDYDTFAADIGELIRHLDLEEVALVGFSMGGGDVVRYLSQNGGGRVSSLVLVSSVTPLLIKTQENPGGVDPGVVDSIRAGIRQDRAQFMSDFAGLFYGTNHGTKVSSGVLTQTLDMALLASLKATVDCVTAFATTDFRSDLPKIEVPTLVIHGDDDQVAPLETTGKLSARLIKGAKLKLYSKGPHGLPATHGDQLNTDLLEFLG